MALLEERGEIERENLVAGKDREGNTTNLVCTAHAEEGEG